MRGRVRVDDRDEQSRALLHAAAQHGIASVVYTLVHDFGADVDAQTSGGDTALHLACAFGHRDVAHMLTRLGASDTIRNLQGHTCHALLRDR